MAKDPDVIVIGAGAAGLAAAVDLGRAGLSVLLLEARPRMGGRILTQRDPIFDVPIELGAEFIHGKPREIWEPLEKRSVPITEVNGDTWCAREGRLYACDFFSQVDEILEQMDDRSADESFFEFLHRRFPNTKRDPRQEEAKRWAVGYVSGFNAADPGLVGVHWLVKGMRAEEEIVGNRAFRSNNGYDDLIETFRQQLAESEVSIRTETVVEQVTWRRDKVEVMARAPEGVRSVRTRRVLLTLPLAVMQAAPGETGAVEFVPRLSPEKLDAMKKLDMGKVIRVVLRFRDRFWESISTGSKTLSQMSFLLSHDEWFPTWWTTMPAKLPIITGWAPFRSAEQLSGKGHEFVVERGVETLGRLLRVSVRDLERGLEAAYFHDWQSDPFSRGAYSYGKVGADGAQEELGRSLDGALFFAGEATDVSGNNGTVHGAIASGRRAAAEIVTPRVR